MDDVMGSKQMQQSHVAVRRRLGRVRLELLLRCFLTTFLTRVSSGKSDVHTGVGICLSNGICMRGMGSEKRMLAGRKDENSEWFSLPCVLPCAGGIDSLKNRSSNVAADRKHCRMYPGHGEIPEVDGGDADTHWAPFSFLSGIDCVVMAPCIQCRRKIGEGTRMGRGCLVLGVQTGAIVKMRSRNNCNYSLDTVLCDSHRERCNRIL